MKRYWYGLSIITLIMLTCLLPGLQAAGENPMGVDNAMASAFANPPAETRILKIVHGLPDDVTAQDGLFQHLQSQGFGGIVTNLSFEQYLESEPKWQAFVRGVKEAKGRGMAMWLYDEKGYPSGNAGGVTMREHPEWEAEGLLIADARSGEGSVSIQIPPGKLVLAKAYPVAGNKGETIDFDKSVDLADRIAERTLTWEAPKGQWRILAVTNYRLYDGTHASICYGDKFPYINLLRPEPTNHFIDVTHQAYAAHLGDDLANDFIATFTDEPSLMSMFMRPQPWSVLPWAPNLPVEFEKRHGYALDQWLPLLIADGGPKTASLRYDFWRTVGDLVSENFFGQIQAWGREHRLPSGGHLLLEEPILQHVPLYGDLFQCERRLDAPSIDCLTSIPEEVPWYIARLISSVANLEGHSITMCETSDHCQQYRPPTDPRPVRIVTEEEIRGTCNRLIMNGVTTITSYYSYAQLSDEQINRLNEWVGRCCMMMKGGYQVTPVAYLYPIQSIWPRFTPSTNWVHDAPPMAKRVEKIYNAGANQLYHSRHDYMYIDARTLAEGTVENGVLHFREMAWRVIVLPCVDTLPQKAWENLAQFWRQGGKVIAMTVLPQNNEKEFPCPAVYAMAEEIFGENPVPDKPNTNNSGGVGVFIPEDQEDRIPVLLDTWNTPELTFSDTKAPLRWTHRVIDKTDVFFVINDGRDPWDGTITLPAIGQGSIEQWDPATGKGIHPATTDQRTIALHLDPFGGMVYRLN